MILLLSGGIDSFVAYHFLGEPRTIYFDMGTPYTEKEIKVVKTIDPNIIIDDSLKFLGATQTGEKAFIPHRNLYLAMRASSYDDKICIAGIKGDDVSDKTERAFELFSHTLTEISGRDVLVFSPFWNMTKDEIVSWYLKYRDNPIDLVHGTVSCYSQSDTNYCGECPSCFRKWVSLINNGIEVPFHNFEMIKEYTKAALSNKYIHDRNVSILRAIAKVYHV